MILYKLAVRELAILPLSEAWLHNELKIKCLSDIFKCNLKAIFLPKCNLGKEKTGFSDSLASPGRAKIIMQYPPVMYTRAEEKIVWGKVSGN